LSQYHRFGRVFEVHFYELWYMVSNESRTEEQLQVSKLFKFNILQSTGLYEQIKLRTYNRSPFVCFVKSELDLPVAFNCDSFAWL